MCGRSLLTTRMMSSFISRLKPVSPSGRRRNSTLAAPRIFAASRASFSRTGPTSQGGSRSLPASPEVRITWVISQPCSASSATVPPQPISMSSGCVPNASTLFCSFFMRPPYPLRDALLPVFPCHAR